MPGGRRMQRQAMAIGPATPIWRITDGMMPPTACISPVIYRRRRLAAGMAAADDDDIV